MATITWARSPQEEALLRRTLSLLAAGGMPVAVADRSASQPFRDFLAGLPGVTVASSEQRLVPQVRASVEQAAATGRPFILYVEPDKEFFVRERLDGFLEEAVREAGAGAGVVVASRSDRSFETFPPMQRYAEGVFNEVCARLLGAVGDYAYGPFLMHRSLVPQLASLPSDLGWGWRPATFVAARRQGLAVRTVVGDYPCPPDQRAEDAEERTHRLRQLGQNILGLVADAGGPTAARG